jgi:hypothetical protein
MWMRFTPAPRRAARDRPVTPSPLTASRYQPLSRAHCSRDAGVRKSTATLVQGRRLRTLMFGQEEEDRRGMGECEPDTQAWQGC